jgi:eukaryotic-like serine/threonine-protein kinase
VSAVLADRYELGRELGAGGMARVVAAHDQLLDREVAVKLLSATSDPSARARFLQEARSAARLSHPDAVAVYDTGEHEGQPFIVMQLIDGETLGDLLDREGALAIEDAVAITLGVLDVLAAAHREGMIHRDIKPGNVLLPSEGGVKLADFGIAKAMDEATTGLTATGVVVGTASYLAPELVEGGTASPASDVYGVGCLLYALLAGQPPFTGDSALAVAYAQRHQPVPPIDELRPEVPADLRAVLDRALVKDPSARYRDAEEMRAALLGGDVGGAAAAPLAAAASEPTAVLASDGPVTTGGAGRRGTLGAVLGALVVALALGALGWWLVGLLGADGLDELEASPADRGGGEVEEPAEGADEPAADEPAADEAEPADEPVPEAEEEPAEETTSEPATVDELVGVLLAAPSGTYGEKQDDLVDKLVDLNREDDPEDRAEDAASLREEVEQWVEKGELDGDIGRVAVGILSREAGG